MMKGTQSWCSVTTLRDGVGREAEEGIKREGTHISMVDSC